jgi:hypothetical protein
MNPGSTKIANVGRIAERIVANELEFRDYQVFDLNCGRRSENADLLAARGGKTFQIQVKAASNAETRWWVQYGFCTDDIIDKKCAMFNRISPCFYKADVVVLVAVKSPREYSCLVLPVSAAEKAAQINLDHRYRTATLEGARKKPGMVSAWIPDARYPPTAPLDVEEARILGPYKDRWDISSV